MYQDSENMRLGGVGVYVRQKIEEMTGKESRCVVLGHLQRGGSPNAFDRMLGTNFGACAVRALASGETGKMVALQAGTIITVPLSEACANIKTVPIDGQLVRTARDIGISFASPKEAIPQDSGSFTTRSLGTAVRPYLSSE